MRLLRFIKRLFLVMVLLGVLFLTFIFRLMQAALSWFIGHVGLVFLLFLFIVLCYYAKQKAEKPLIHSFLGKHVLVKVSEGLTVEGTLVFYEFGRKTKPHRPNVLILKNDDGFHVLRGNWLSISGMGENGRS